MPLPIVHVFCDGACSPNPGWGGWGAVLLAPNHNNHRRELSGAEPDSTNNRMELMGAIMALRALRQPCEVVLHTDSTYVRNAFHKGWLTKWANNGWLTAEKKPVANVDLWNDLVALAGLHEIEWVWVKGHGTNVEHNRCDVLAVEARLSLAAQSAAVPQESALDHPLPAPV